MWKTCIVWGGRYIGCREWNETVSEKQRFQKLILGFPTWNNQFFISSIINMVELDDYFSLRLKISFLLLSTNDFFLESFDYKVKSSDRWYIDVTYSLQNHRSRQVKTEKIQIYLKTRLLIQYSSHFDFQPPAPEWMVLVVLKKCVSFLVKLQIISGI